MKIAAGIHRIGTGRVNVYLVEEGGDVTIIDAGAPGYWKELPAELTAMGSSFERVRALVLTHGHPDHIGFAERLRREKGVPIRVHELDAALARGEVRAPMKGFGRIRPGPALGFLWFGIRQGLLRTTPLVEVSTYGDGATLDVPGTPRVILPGHTPGSAALHVASHQALFSGDAIVTGNPFSGQVGPQIAPFTADAAQALTSLSRLENVEASTLLPGHGDPWTGGVQAALTLARGSVRRA